MLQNEWAKSGKGRRTLFGKITCLDADNMMADFKSHAFLADNAENAQMITCGEEKICFTANGETYIKWLNVKPNTQYFLFFEGRTQPPEWTDIHFGIADSDKRPLKNYHTKHEKDFYVFDQGTDQTLTVRGQDGEWYHRTYAFNTGSNRKIGFFADGTVGRVFLRDLKIFEAVCARPPKTRNSGDFNWVEDIKTCLPEHNLIKSEHFDKFENFNTFIFRKENVIIYKNANRGCYYFAWLPIESNAIYTFAYKCRVRKIGGAAYGFVVEKPDGKRYWLSQKSASSLCGIEQQADAFVIAEGDKVAFAVFDGGGEVEFTDFKIFLFGNGKESL